MSVSYTKEQRELAKRKGLHLCTVASRGIVLQGCHDAVSAGLIEDCAVHLMCLYEGQPFKAVTGMEIPVDLSDAFEDLKFAITRQRAMEFSGFERHKVLALLNSLRHYVLMPVKEFGE